MKLNEIAEYEDYSSFRFEKYLNVYETKDKQYFLNLIKNINVEPPTIFNPEMEILHHVTPSDNPYYISHQYYNTIDLWWFICSYNKIQNPLSPIEPGTTLRILKIDYVKEIVVRMLKEV